MSRLVGDLSDGELETFAKNYRDQGRITGGKFSLSELLLEKLRRTPCSASGADVTKFIIDKGKLANDGKVTYLEVWSNFFENQPWKGNHSLREVGGLLDRAIAYCIDSGLPIVTTIVVQTGSRSLTQAAKKNIAMRCKELGVDVGHVPEAFVDSEAARTLSV